MKEFWKRNKFNPVDAFLGLKEVESKKLPPTIDMSFMTPHMNDLYAIQHPVHVIPEAKRIEAIDRARKGLVEGVDPQSEESMGRYIEFIERKDNGERMALLYYDGTEKAVMRSRIYFGDYDNVQFELPDPSKTLSLAEIHTHPDNSFFSMTDLKRLIKSADYWGFSKNRGTNMGIVLCPDVQYMLIPTKDTPKETMDGHVLHLNDGESQIFDRMNKHHRRVALRGYRINRYEGKVIRDYEWKVDDFEWKKKIEVINGEITQEEADAQIEEFKRKHAEVGNPKLARLSEIRKRLNAKSEMNGKRKLEGALVQFAQSRGFGIYYSTDRAHFTKMDAVPEFVFKPAA